MISRRNLDPRAFDLAVERPRSSLLPSSIQLLRCTAEAVRRPGARLLGVPAIRWSVGSLVERTDQGIYWILTRLDGSEDLPANRRSSWGGPGCSRVDPSYSICRCRVRGRRRGGGDEETRTPDPLLAKEMLCQLSYVPVTRSRREVVGAPGLEPGTSALSGPRSNQLSYAPWRLPHRSSGRAAAP